MLAAALTACATPNDLDLSLRHPSAQGRYVVEMEPPAAAPTINQIHTWQIKLSPPDGAPVRNARIAVDGGMPQHGHGLPTRPQPAAWSFEVAVIAFGWLVFFGSAACIRWRMHADVDVLVAMMPPAWRRAIFIFNWFLLAALFLVLTAMFAW